MRLRQSLWHLPRPTEAKSPSQHPFDLCSYEPLFLSKNDMSQCDGLEQKRFHLPCGNGGNDCKYIHTAFNSPSVICPKYFHGMKSFRWCPLGVTPVRRVLMKSSSDQKPTSPDRKSTRLNSSHQL